MNVDVLNPNPLLPVLPFEFGERLDMEALLLDAT